MKKKLENVITTMDKEIDVVFEIENIKSLFQLEDKNLEKQENLVKQLIFEYFCRKYYEGNEKTLWAYANYEKPLQKAYENFCKKINIEDVLNELYLQE